MISDSPTQKAHLAMSKRPETHDTIRLALELIRRIPRGAPISSSTLRDQLADMGIEREPRTIQRQLEMLSKHFNIERNEESKPYSYRWKSGSVGFSMSKLSNQESLLLSLAQENLSKLLPQNLMRSMDNFFYQANSNLRSGTNTKHEREWLSKVMVVSETQPLLPPKVSDKVMDAISAALYGNLWLDIDYSNAIGKRSKADVMPLGLVQQGERLYLVCRFRQYECENDGERLLALHRISSATASTLNFTRPAEFSLSKYVEDGHFGYGKGTPIKLSFKIQKDDGLHLTESMLSKDQIVTELKDEYEITATVRDTLVLNRWLNGFGDAVRDIRKEPIK